MKTDIKRKTVKKKSVTSGIVIVLLALNVLTLAFTVAKGGIEYLLESEFHYANGFTLAFSGYPPIVDGVGAWLRIYSAAHLVIALLLIFVLGIWALAKRTLDFGGLGTFSVAVSVLLSILYMVHGIIAYSTASDYVVSEHYHCSTAAFIPFIITFVLAVLFFLVKYKAPEQIELS